MIHVTVTECSQPETGKEMDEKLYEIRSYVTKISIRMKKRRITESQH